MEGVCLHCRPRATYCNAFVKPYRATSPSLYLILPSATRIIEHVFNAHVEHFEFHFESSFHCESARACKKCLFRFVAPGTIDHRKNEKVRSHLSEGGQEMEKHLFLEYDGAGDESQTKVAVRSCYLVIYVPDILSLAADPCWRTPTIQRLVNRTSYYSYITTHLPKQPASWPASGVGCVVRATE